LSTVSVIQYPGTSFATLTQACRQAGKIALIYGRLNRPPCAGHPPQV
jgi:hypothetical protein